MLELYRRALRLRRAHLVGAPGEVAWLDVPAGVLALARGPWQCWVNTGDAAVDLPVGEVVHCSDPDASPGVLPGAAAAWVLMGSNAG